MTSEDHKKDLIANFRYLGPFTLFCELESFLKRDKSESESKDSDTGSVSRYSQTVKEMKDTSDNKVHLLDIVGMRKDFPELFWNLIYRFTVDKRDHLFLLPYEIDLFPEQFVEPEEKYELKVKEEFKDDSDNILLKTQKDPWGVVEEKESENNSDGHSQENKTKEKLDSLPATEEPLNVEEQEPAVENEESEEEYEKRAELTDTQVRKCQLIFPQFQSTD